MVDRKDPASRKKVYARIKKRLDKGLSIAIFPEGLVPTENIALAPFNNGAFSLSIQYQTMERIMDKAKMLFLSEDLPLNNPQTYPKKKNLL